MLHITPLVLDVYLSFALAAGPPKLDYEQQYLDLFVPLSHPVAVASRPKGEVIDLKQYLASRKTGDHA